MTDDLSDRERWLVFNKSDTLPEAELQALVKKSLQRLRFKGRYFVISAVSRKGVPELAEAAMQWVEAQRAANRDRLDAESDESPVAPQD